MTDRLVEDASAMVAYIVGSPLAGRVANRIAGADVRVSNWVASSR